MKVLYTANSAKAKIENVLYDAFTNNGIVGLPTKDKHIVQLEFKDVFNLPSAFSKVEDLKDTITTKDLTRFIETSVTRIVREALEPNLLIVPMLFQAIQYEGPGRSVEIGSMGAIHAATVPEGGEYPEVEFNFGDGDMVQVGLEKHGLKLRVTEEVISDNLFDVFGLWLRMAGRALARHKEQYGMKLLSDMGIDVFNNDNPSGSELGATTGRAIDGSKNNTMTTNDIFDLYTYLYLRGFMPNVLLMNPLAWKTFMTDAETREIVLQGAVLASRQLPEGSPAPGYGTGHNGLGLRTTATGVPLDDPNKVAGNNPFVTSLNPLGATFYIAPRYLPTPITVIVSPHVPYVPATGAAKPKTDIIMADSTRCGILITKEGVSLDEWNDPERDIRAMRIKERWGMALFEQGKGVAVARNVTIDRNYSFENVNQVTITP